MRIRLFSLIPLLALMGFGHFSDDLAKEDRIVFDVINETADLIEKKYDASRCGIGMSGHFKYLEISFQVSKRLNRDEARALLVDCVEEFQNRINSNEKLRPYLKVYPFSYENIGITVFINSSDKKELFHPDIGIAAATSFDFCYKTVDPENTCQFKEIHRETHEEAIAKVKAQHPEFKFGSWPKVGVSDQSSRIE